MVNSIIKLDAYLHLPRLSVGNKLCSLHLHLPKFFMQLLVYPVTVFSLGRQSLKNQVTPMSDQKKTQMRMALSDLKLIIIDEISVVSNTLLLHIHQQLTLTLTLTLYFLFIFHIPKLFFLQEYFFSLLTPLLYSTVFSLCLIINFFLSFLSTTLHEHVPNSILYCPS